MTNIFIANLDFDITSEDLKSTFSQFGTVSYAHVVFDNKTKKSKGFGYVEMDDSDEAISAIQVLNGIEVNGRAIDVKVASPKGNRPEKSKTEPERKPFSPARKKSNFSTPTRTVQRKTEEVKDEEPKRVMRPRRKRI